MPRWPTRTTDERFWAKVDRSGGPDACWPWTAFRNPKGYGMFMINGHARLAHRVAFTLTRGPLPAGMLARHQCDNRPCCNPAHLAPGTQLDNMADVAARGRGGYLTKPERIPRGERHASARLTDDIVRALRRERAERGTTYAVLASRHGVAESVIYHAINRKTWRHVS